MPERKHGNLKLQSYMGGGGGGKWCLVREVNRVLCCSHGPGSVVGIATGYGLNGPGIKSWWEPDFPHLSRPVRGPAHPPVQWVPGLSWG